MSPNRTYGPVCVFALTSLVIANLYLYTVLYLTRTGPFAPSSTTTSSAMSHPIDYASAARIKHPPSLVKPRLVASVPSELVPTTHNRRRLVFVGDIHGMIHELDELLARVAFDPATDHLVACGDMINKGTSSAAVIDRLMQLGASAVRGNHEEHVLNAWVEDTAKGAFDGSLSRQKESHKHRETARSLTDEQLHWLAKLPIILTFDPLPVYAVHGGLVPGVRLQHQEPWAVMNMRTLLVPHKKPSKVKQHHDQSSADTFPDEQSPPGAPPADEPPTSEPSAEQVLHDGPLVPPSRDHDDDDDSEVDAEASHVDYSAAVPIEGRDGIKWTKAWNTYQKRLPKTQRRTVIYGHDAKRGYKEAKYTVGLDSNCVGGGALTGLVVEATKNSFKHKTIHVKCKSKVADKADKA